MNGECVTLIGMPGAGKSTLGVVLAKVLQLDFVDADLEIQRRYGASLRSLIEAKGPEAFIRAEGLVLEGLSPKDAVIATGGSAIYSPDAMDHLSSLGPIVYLRTSKEELAQRLGDLSERGVVMRGGEAMTSSSVIAERVPLYERYGDLTVDTDGRTITETAHDVARRLAPVMGLPHDGFEPGAVTL